MEILREQFNEIKNYKEILPKDYFDTVNDLIEDKLTKNTPENYNDIINLLMELNKVIQKTNKNEESIEDILQNELEFELDTLLETMPEYFYGSYSIHLPLVIESENVGVGDVKLEALIDTGAQINTINYDVVEKLGMLHKIYKQKTTLLGVGSQVSEGFIPKLIIKLGDGTELIVPRVIVLKQTDKSLKNDMILGINTMFYYGFNLDLKNRKLTIDNKELEIKLVDTQAKNNNEGEKSI